MPETQTVAPHYQHDCRHCEYRGSLLMDGEWVDWYICRTSGSVVGRYGKEGWEYWSCHKDLVRPDANSPYMRVACGLIGR